MVHAPQGAASAATIENVPGEWRQNSVARSLRADSHASNHSNRSIPERSGSSSSGTRPGSGQPHGSGGSDPALLLGLLGPLAAAKPYGHAGRVAPAPPPPPPPPPRCHTQAVLLRFARRNNWTDHRLDMVSKLVGGSAASQIDLSPQQRHLSAFDSSSLRGRHSEPLPKPGSGGPSASAAVTGRGGRDGEATEDGERRSSSFSSAQAQFQRPGSTMESVAEDPLDGASAATPVVLRGSESAPQVVEAAKPAQGGGGKGGPDSPLAHRISLPMMALPGEHIPAPLPLAEWPAGGRGTVSEAGMSAEFSGYPKQPALARLLVRLQKQAASGELLAGGGRPGGLGTSPRGGPKAAGRTTLSGAEGTGGAAVPSGARTRRMSAATYPSDDAPSPSLAPSPFGALSGAHSRSRRLSAEGPGRASPGGLFAVAADATSALARSRSRRLPMASPDEASAPAAPASDVFSVTAAAADVTSALARSRSRRLPTANAASDVLAATAAAAADATSALARSRSRRLPTASATSDVFSAAAAVADTTSASTRSRSSRLPAVNTRAGDAAAVSASADAALAPHQALGVSSRSRIVRWQSEASEGEGGGGRSRHVSDTGGAGAPERESSRRSGGGGAACSVSRASSMSRASSITSRSSSCVRAGPACSSGSLTAWSPLHLADWAASTPTHGSGQPEERTSRSSIIRKPRASCAAAADRASTSKKVSFQIAVTAVMAAAALSHHQPVAAMEKLAEEERAGGDASEAGSGRAAADATVAGSG